MSDFSILAVLVAGVAAFVLSGAYYATFGQQLAAASDPATTESRMPPWKLAVELLRSLIVATVVAGLASRGDINEWPGGLLLGFVLWVGFPVVLWIGAIIHENTPLRLAVIHGGDWLGKLLVIGVIVSAWQ
jgi:Protein of unknown function (DUF1761)